MLKKNKRCHNHADYADDDIGMLLWLHGNFRIFIFVLHKAKDKPKKEMLLVLLLLALN